MEQPQHRAQIAAARLNDPRQRFPAHIAGLSTHLQEQGDNLAHWTILHAAETRLDEDGMVVELVVLRSAPASEIRTYAITVSQGRMTGIRLHVGDPAPRTPLRNPALPSR